MKQTERVELLRPVFPGYDAPLDSKVHRPQKYGITYTRKARDLLNGVPKNKADTYYLSVRLGREIEAELRAALKGKEPCDWLREQVDRVIKRHKKAAPTAGTVETAAPEKS